MASLITFTPGTTIKSTDVNADFSSLNNAKVERSGDTMTGSLWIGPGTTLWVNQQTAYGASPYITMPIGDSDTGIHWYADGHIGIFSNAAALIDISLGNTVNITAPNAWVNGHTICAAIGFAQIFVQSYAPTTGNVGDIWLNTSVSL